MAKTNESVEKAISDLTTKGSVKTSGNIFNSVIKALRTSYSKLIEDKSISINYSNYKITLN